MALRHYSRLERQVRVGGFGPPRHRFGGRWYSVGPVSVMGWVQLSAVLSPLSAKGALGPEFGEVFKSLPREISGALLPLLLNERPRPRDLNRVTPDQLAAAWEAFCQVNDMAYIQEAFTPKHDTKPTEGNGLAMDDMAMILSGKVGISPDELLRLPMQVFLSMLDSLRRLRNVAENRPADCDAPDESEISPFRDAFTAAGFEVN